MNQELDNKIETILLSCVNRLYEKEANIGLDLEDLRALEILYKIAKEGKQSTSDSPISVTAPVNISELLRIAKGIPSNDNQ